MNTLFTQQSCCSNKSALAASAHPNYRFSPQKSAPATAAAPSEVDEPNPQNASLMKTELANEELIKGKLLPSGQRNFTP